MQNECVEVQYVALNVMNDSIYVEIKIFCCYLEESYYN